MQAWPLERKIRVSQSRIMKWYGHWGGQVYVSFSGGKDSTVLLDLARRVYPDIEAVFCDTGLEYPEVRKFALSHSNVTKIKPVDMEMPRSCGDCILYQFCTYDRTGICEAENFKDVIPDDSVRKELVSE